MFRSLLFPEFVDSETDSKKESKIDESKDIALLIDYPNEETQAQESFNSLKLYFPKTESAKASS